jgi:ligand-binding SRPBCC domain-containing protein
VNCHIDKVWEFYIDIKHLGIITPKEIELKIINSTGQKLAQGSEIWLEGKIMMMLPKRTKWHSKITLFSASSQKREYVDEMLTGPFKKWRHLHKFDDTDNSQKQTQVMDQIDFELPCGILGRLFDGYAERTLEKLFYHRKLATIRALENKL